MKKPCELDINLSKIKVILPNGRALFSISNLLIPYGSHILIQGESGKGKSTLLHLIAGLFSPQEGRVQIGQVDFRALTDDECCDFRMKKIGIIFQKLNLIDHLTVAENILLSLSPDTEDADAGIEAALERANLKGRNQERCSLLSLGEQQRVAVARVLAQKPDIVLADEPTSSLDEKNSFFVMDALKEVTKGRTLVVVSHDRRISSCFDQVISFEELTK